jgi:hypothetical protein
MIIEKHTDINVGTVTGRMSEFVQDLPTSIDSWRKHTERILRNLKGKLRIAQKSLKSIQNKSQINRKTRLWYKRKT